MTLMMRTGLALATLCAALVAPTARAAVPPVDADGKAAKIRCGSTAGGAAIAARHADKIVFQIAGFLLADLPADQVALDAIPRNTALDIKVLDDPATVADLKGKVLTFLGARDGPANREQIGINQVLYAMVCPTTAAP